MRFSPASAWDAGGSATPAAFDTWPGIDTPMSPGQMQLTCTPLSVSSAATVRVSWITAALAAL